MFVTRTTLQGITQLCGAFCLHLALLVTILLYMPQGNYQGEERSYDGINSPDDQRLWKMMVVSHSMLAISCLCITQNLFEGALQQVICYASVIVYILMIEQIIKEFFFQPTFIQMIKENDVAQMSRATFFYYEFSVFVITIISNCLFFSIRMFQPNQISLTKVEPRRQLTETDTMKALAVLVSQYMGFVIPCLTNVWTYSFNVHKGTPRRFLTCVGYYTFFQCIQFVIVHFLVFVSWKKGPKCWQQIAPRLYMGLTVLNYLVIPFWLMFWTHNNWAQIKGNIFFLSIFVSMFCQMAHPVHFYVTVYSQLIPDAKSYIEQRERKQLLDEQLGSNAAQKHNNNTLGLSQEAQYIELKEMTNKINKNYDGMSDNSKMTATENGFDVADGGLTSMTNYTAFEPELISEDSFVDQANNTVPYSKQKRGFGEGDVRIGKSLNLSENIYTLAFVAELANEEIDSVTQENGGKPPETKDMLTTPRGTVIGFENWDENDPSFLENEAEMQQWEQKTMKRYETFKNERVLLDIHVFVTSVSQIIILYLLFKESRETLNFKQVVIQNVNLNLLAAKGICAVILHMAMYVNVQQGLSMMKYALNHEKRFLNYFNAARLGLFRTLTSAAVESISLLIVWSSPTVLDVVFNFISLAVIDEFDVFVYEALRSCTFKELLKEENQETLLKISFTSSDRALSGELGEASDMKDDEGKFLCNKIRFWQDRGIFNKVHWLIYKMLRVWYVVVYFYFYPTTIIFGNFISSYMIARSAQ